MPLHADRRPHASHLPRQLRIHPDDVVIRARFLSGKHKGFYI